ncbi:hypothetical protein KSP40_PGU003934 [Platanthera guangdongensis]|uniref:Ubiquitin-like protease family profile domain-containing protein n=1 Tax=Platanthera guangdongensis TaxID=2320717 RepID=A0ABR2MZQ0_9ASPA
MGKEEKKEMDTGFIRERKSIGVEIDLKQFRRAKFKGSKTMLSHITKDSVTYSDLLLILIYVNGHWALVVGNMKDEIWEFYDSLPNPIHLRSTHEVLKFVHEDIGRSLPARVHEWSIIPVEGIPAQESGDDCGLFVLMFMKTTVSRKKCSWRKTQSWKKNASISSGNYS